jgi:hypothetical protein
VIWGCYFAVGARDEQGQASQGVLRKTVHSDKRPSVEVLRVSMPTNPECTYLPIPDERFDVKRIERSRNLSENAWLRQLY